MQALQAQEMLGSAHGEVSDEFFCYAVLELRQVLQPVTCTLPNVVMNVDWHLPDLGASRVRGSLYLTKDVIAFVPTDRQCAINSFLFSLHVVSDEYVQIQLENSAKLCFTVVMQANESREVSFEISNTWELSVMDFFWFFAEYLDDCRLSRCCRLSKGNKSEQHNSKKDKMAFVDVSFPRHIFVPI
mmetsp:Transcript_15153/g.24938  ORF Transcript_15153/g.24938 Transcript_15153/m.24938 type:complete len:186 (+) Transcript_15153:180-737(+)